MSSCRIIVYALLLVGCSTFANDDEFEIIQQIDLKCFLLSRLAVEDMIANQAINAVEVEDYLASKFEKINCLAQDQTIVIHFKLLPIPNRDWRKIIDRPNYSYVFDPETLEILKRNY